MTIKFLYSSSAGNSTIIESLNTTIMIDAGVSYKKIKAAYGDDPVLDGIFITHEHYDHINSAGVVARKASCPVYISKASFSLKEVLFENCEIIHIESEQKIVINNLEITPFETKHDSLGCLGFAIKELDTNKKFVFVTDSGIVTKLMKDYLSDADGYFIESDYDEEELEKYAEYEDELKSRIKSPFGHLSNQQTIEYIDKNINFGKTQFIALGHLSKNTNSPEILRTRIEQFLPEEIWNKIHIIDQTTILTI